MQYGAIPTSLLERIALASGMVPIPVLDTLFAMLKARSVMAGVRLGVFDGLAQTSRTAAELAGDLSLDAEGLELLLRTLVYCGYLEIDSDHFSLSALGAWALGVALDLAGGPLNATGWMAAFSVLAAGILLGPLALYWSRMVAATS